jgi:CRISPR-associated exonuclease Cas4
MSAGLLLLLVTFAVVAYVLLGRWSRRHRVLLGIADGKIVSADDSITGSSNLHSERLGVAGRCDHLLRVQRAYVPVEQKPSARRLYESHIIQMGALCVLIEDVYGVRPPYGVVVLADGIKERVSFTKELEQRVLRTMADMRSLLRTQEQPGPRWVQAKCGTCGYRQLCWSI